MARQRHNSAASSHHTAHSARGDDVHVPSPAKSSNNSHGYSKSTSNGGGQEMGSMYDYLAKVILLGPSGCGKSCLLHRFVKGEWRVLSSQTVGVEFASKIVKVGNNDMLLNQRGDRRKRLKLQLWDTAGTERFRSVSRSYYRGATAAVLVYDVTDPRSFAELPTFLHDAQSLASPQLTVILVGNKSDLADPDALVATEASTPNDANDETDPLGDNFQSSSSMRSTHSFSSSIPSHHNSPYRSSSHNQQRATTSTLGRAVPLSAATAWASANGIAATLEVSALSGANVDAIFSKLAGTVLTKLELGEIDPDDPLSGVQYGDADYYDDASSSVRSYGGGLTSDGFNNGSVRRRKRRGGWGDVLRLGSRPRSSAGSASGGMCC